jgi:hypothetical protein
MLFMTAMLLDTRTWIHQYNIIHQLRERGIFSILDLKKKENASWLRIIGAS